MSKKQKKQSNKFMVRQGDVLVYSSDAMPKTEGAKREEGYVILAHGEVTGHHHRIQAKGPQATLLRPEGISDAVLTVNLEEQPPTVEGLGPLTRAILEASETPKAFLVHEEHSAIPIPNGTYIVRRQKEYSEQEIRNVAD